MNIFSYTHAAVRTLPMKGRRNVLKIMTLGVGLAVGLVLASKVCFEKTFDDFYKDADRIYYLNEAMELNGIYRVYPQVAGGVAPKMKEYFPQIEEATRFTYIFETASLLMPESDKRVDAGLTCLSDTSFFRVFDRKCLAGNLTEPLGIEANVVISSKLATKMAAALTSGKKMDEKAAAAAVLGQKFTIAGDTQKYELTVGGVYEEFPLNSSYRLDMIVSMPSIGHFMYDGSENMVGNDRYIGFIKLKKGIDPGEIENGLPGFMDKHMPMDELRAAGYEMKLPIKPFVKFHEEDETQRNMTLVLAFVAFALLLTSMLNYLLIVLSSAAIRAREMALRKCLGSSAKDIFGMMFAEALVHTAIAAAVAAILIFSFRSMIETILGVNVIALFTGRPLALALTIIVVLLALNSLLPAFFFNRIPVAAAFRNYRAGKRMWKLGLLAVEFAAVVFLAVVMSVINLQYDKMMNADRGFKYDDVAMIAMPEATQSQKNMLMSEVRSLSGVEDASFAYQNPFTGYSGDNVSVPGEDRQLFNIRDAYYVDEHYFNVFGIKIQEGSNFDPTLNSDAEMIVDRNFVKMMKNTAGWDEVLGREVMVTSHETGPVRICGIIDDIHTGGFSVAEADFGGRPMGIFYCDSEKYAGMFNYIFVKYHKMSPEELQKTDEITGKILDGQWYRIYPCNELAASNFVDTLNTRNSILAGGIVTLFIALIGLIGYTIDEVRRRSKEIAVRRVNGAQFSQIRSMFLRDVMAVALPSVAVGAVLAYIVAGRWEQNFSLQAGLPWWIFLGAIAAALAIVAIISDIYVIRTAGTNPADSIKTE